MGAGEAGVSERFLLETTKIICIRARSTAVFEGHDLDLACETGLDEALESLAQFMPSKIMKLFTRLFDHEQLKQIFHGGVAEHMAMACRLYALVRRLIQWSRIWKRQKACELLRHFLRLTPPLGHRLPPAFGSVFFINYDL